MRRVATVVLALGLLMTIGSAASAGGRPFTTPLEGSQEVPGPGDPDGSGWARVTVNPGTLEVCYQLQVEDVDPIVAAHIHAAPAGSAGSVVVSLDPTFNADGYASGCVSASDRALAKAIVTMPWDYYVNVHNATYPAGALRGQLG
jgi:hypothetical protein